MGIYLPGNKRLFLGASSYSWRCGAKSMSDSFRMSVVPCPQMESFGFEFILLSFQTSISLSSSASASAQPQAPHAAAEQINPVRPFLSTFAPFVEFWTFLPCPKSGERELFVMGAMGGEWRTVNDTQGGMDWLRVGWPENPLWRHQKISLLRSFSVLVLSKERSNSKYPTFGKLYT